MKNLNSLVAAYMAIWVIFFGYQFWISRRLARLQEEVEKLKDDSGGANLEYSAKR